MEHRLLSVMDVAHYSSALGGGASASRLNDTLINAVDSDLLSVHRRSRATDTEPFKTYLNTIYLWLVLNSRRPSIPVLYRRRAAPARSASENFIGFFYLLLLSYFSYEKVDTASVFYGR